VKQFGRFLVGGGAATLLQFIVAGSLSFFVWLPLTHVISLLSGIFYNYFHQSKYVFKGKPSYAQFTKFTGYNLFNGGLQSIFVFGLVYHIGLPYMLSLALTIAGLSICSFIVYQNIIFSKR